MKLVSGVLLMVASLSAQAKTLKVGYPATWGTLVPSLQSTVYADSILGNVYDPLVDIGPSGRAIPLAAKSWTISPDLKVFTFTIDTQRKFPNGKSLESYDFKKAWEYGRSLTPDSSNHSLDDVLQKLVGFDDFQEKKTIEGIETPNARTLILKFKEPFRIALDHLSGARFAAFIKEGDRYLGTGRFQLIEHSERSVPSAAVRDMGGTLIDDPCIA